MRLGDESGDLGLRIYVRRATCLVFGNLGVPDLEQRVRDMLALTLEAGDRWEEAISRNDLACFLQGSDPVAAEAEIARALAAASVAGPDDRSRSASSIPREPTSCSRPAGPRPHSRTRGERSGCCPPRPTEPPSGGEPNPHVLAVTVRAEVQAQLALGQAFQELIELQLGLERARMEAAAAREQADRDWLTGLRQPSLPGPGDERPARRPARRATRARRSRP